MTSPIARDASRTLDRGDFTRCDHPEKIAHPSKAAARRHARTVAGTGDRGLHPYACPAGHWHCGHERERAR